MISVSLWFNYHFLQMPELPIYMDHHATTPADPRVVEAMLPFFSENFGNPASLTHDYGRRPNSTVSASWSRAEPGALARRLSIALSAAAQR